MKSLIKALLDCGLKVLGLYFLIICFATGIDFGIKWTNGILVGIIIGLLVYIYRSKRRSDQ